MSGSREAVGVGYVVRVFAEASQGIIGNNIFIKASGAIFATGFVIIDKETTSDGIFEYLDGRTQNRLSSIN